MAKIIINADDFGLNERCTRGITEAFSKKMVTDTTACANGYFFDEAVKLARQYNFSDKIGIHLNLTEGYPLTENMQEDAFFCNKEGRFDKRILNNDDVLPTGSIENIKAELSAQIEKLADNIKITHADSHHYIHSKENLAVIISEILKNHGIEKIRIAKNLIVKNDNLSRRNKSVNDYFKSQNFILSDYFGGESEYPDIISDGEYTVELMVHPSYDKNNLLIDKRGMEDFPTGKSLEKTVERFLKEKISSYSEL